MFNPSSIEEAYLPASVSMSVGPNPVRDRTSIDFALPGYGRVDLRVYDVQGRCLRTLAERQVTEPGQHRLVWDGRDDQGRRLASGIYYVRLQVNGRDRASSKVVVLK